MAAVAGSRMKVVALVVMVLGALTAMGTMRGCEEKTAAGVTPVKIKGQPFHLEIAAENEKRMKGMGDRTHIDDDGGMIFVFTRADTKVQNFVMRDCPIPSDIIYCDGSGRVLATHTMVAEEPRGSRPDDAEIDPKTNQPRYEARLPQYSSRFPSQLVIEVKAGTIQKLGVKEGDLVELKAEELKKLAK